VPRPEDLVVKNGIENAIELFGGNTAARVRHFDFDRTILRRRPNFEHSSGWHGIARVHEEIEEHLLEPRR
jgi:hypothetical protein